jgi:DNA modification methylase
MSVRILNGDCRDVLASLPAESVHCCVTSPPYWGLRDYGVAGQIGLESTYQDFVAQMVAVFREIRRVLRADGTLWLNLGDSYAASRSYQVTDNKNPAVGPTRHLGCAVPPAGLKQKDLVGIPWRVAFALQADGWWLRQDIIWSKPNPMPESVTDRCTKAHEYVFLLSKSERYYFDQKAIAEPAVKAGQVLHSHGTGAKDRQDVSDTNDRRTRIGLANWDQAQPDTRNKRSVWEVATAPFSEAHFATFPPALIEPCILAGCPKGGTVLDPFGGAGTTGLVADRLHRDAILIELNPAYADMSRKRIIGDAPLFVAAE